MTIKQDTAIATAQLSRRGQREGGREMKIDTEIRHVTKPGANLFLELGFAPDAAKRYKLHLTSRSMTLGC